MLARLCDCALTSASSSPHHWNLRRLNAAGRRRLSGTIRRSLADSSGTAASEEAVPIQLCLRTSSYTNHSNLGSRPAPSNHLGRMAELPKAPDS